MYCKHKTRDSGSVTPSVSLSALVCGHQLPLEHFNCKILQFTLRLTFDIDIYHSKHTESSVPPAQPDYCFIPAGQGPGTTELTPLWLFYCGRCCPGTDRSTATLGWPGSWWAVGGGRWWAEDNISIGQDKRRTITLIIPDMLQPALALMT